MSETATGPGASRRIVVAYVATNALFTLATSLIWGVNTLFLMSTGLDIFHVMLVNATYSAGQMVFEVPTGVIADTLGRKISFLFGIATLVASTLLYVGTAQYGWGMSGFVVASVLLGLGYTFQTGAVDAWLVDALDATGYTSPKERVFAWGSIAFSVAMIAGTLGGGFLGQVDLRLPYLVRAAVLVVCLGVTGVMMREIGFERRALRLSQFGTETRRILKAGVAYGWKHRVVRPMLFVSLVGGGVFMFVWYSWQRFALDLLGRDLIWVAGLMAALNASASIVGNLICDRMTRKGPIRRAARLLAATGVAIAAAIGGIALVGILAPGPGVWTLAAATVLWVVWGVFFGIEGPVRQGYLNQQIPSEQRATVLSLSALFADAGGVAGQPLLGRISQVLSMPVAWLVSAGIMTIWFPLYRRAERAEELE